MRPLTLYYIKLTNLLLWVLSINKCCIFLLVIASLTNISCLLLQILLKKLQHTNMAMLSLKKDLKIIHYCVIKYIFLYH